ncbi:GumC family protein [Pontibacter mangrovi]|uniref:non-specific protein-tyrosine kinase n=1 Tax=Pontibacter mangrovi TaxID=2589816 RepID=A0A501VZX6_9BACT|nr:tyrosine-protein kinase [Pontibacter mangrovi]TPE42979.1 polysaccharide biosynthesis tyrosine autokinase [Pontibacter mangrovi]
MPSSENNIFSSLLYKYLPYWPLFALLLLISCLGTWGYLRYFAIPSYETSASLIIKDENKGVNDAKMTESIDAFTSNKIVENEIKVLYSRTLLKEVVEDLKLYAPVFEEGKFKTTSAYITSPVQIEVKHPEALKETAKVYFHYNRASKQVIINNDEYSTGKWVQTPYGIIRFSLNTRKEGIAKHPLYFSLIRPKKIVESLEKNIKIEAENKLSTVVNFTLYDQIPARGEDILNTLIYTYNSIAINERNKLAANTLEFVEDRIKLVEEELKDLENKVVKYKSSEGVVNLSEQGKLYLESVEGRDLKMSDIDLQLAVLDKVENYVIAKEKARGIVPSTLGLNDAVLSQLLQKLYNAEIEYQKLRNTTAENNPMLLTLAEEIQNVRPGILENIQNQREALQASRSKLASTNRRYQAELKFIPKQEKELMEISRQQAIKNNAYSFLLQKREETVLSYAPNAGDSRVVDMAESSSLPVKPRPLYFYLIAVALSFALGIAFVTSKDLFNRKLLFRSEIEANTNTPIVAELSLTKRRKGKSFVEPAETSILEQFRKLRVTLGLYGHHNKKRIMITSNIPGEGKSFVCSNLAYILATSGQNVVLVDFDLRNPNASVLFDMYKQEGVTEFLLCKSTPEAIVKETGFPNLRIVPAGIAIGDYTDFMLNGKFSALLDSLEKDFEYIIIDTPPVDLVTDAYLISKHCDITLLVMRHAYTPKNLVQDLSQNHVLQSLKNVAIVFNGVRPRGFVRGQYGYGYGYGNVSMYDDRTYHARRVKARA